jgi:hypothetical protein
MIELEANSKIKILIDEEDKNLIEKHKWYLTPKNQSIITCFRIKGEKVTFTIGRFILSEYGYTFSKEDLVCYKDKNIFNNTKENFIIRNKSENNKHRKPSRWRRKVLPKRDLPYGVYRCKRNNYQATIRVGGKLKWLGRYKQIKDAQIAVENALKLFGY